jgi:cobalamin biosynthesis protein CbiD
LSRQAPDSTNTLFFFAENRFLRYQQVRINVGHGAGYVIEPGR